MVHEVEPPEQRHPVIEAMPDVHGVVEQQEAGGPREGRRDRQPVQQADARSLGGAGDADADGHQRESHDQRRAERDEGVGGQPLGARPDAAPQRGAGLEQKERGEREADGGAAERVEPRHDAARWPRACTSCA